MNSTKLSSIFWKVIYFLLIVPMGLLLRLTRVRLLDLEKNNSDSYWRVRREDTDPKKTYRNIG